MRTHPAFAPAVSGAGASALPANGLLRNLGEMERTREAYWRRYPATSPTRLRWRAQAVRHAMHVTAGDAVLEIGAGGGMWTRELARTLPDAVITAAVLNAELFGEAERSGASDAILVRSPGDLAPRSFDYVVGTAILSHDRYQEHLDWVRTLLRPGGQLLFFEANYWNPQVFAKAQSVRVARWSRNAECQIALRKAAVGRALDQQGFVDSVVVPYDILHPRTPSRLVPTVQSAAFVAEHMPGVRELCGQLFINARLPGHAHRRARPDLSRHPQFRDAVSVVVPCHNEAMNIGPLVTALRESYDPYLKEIILVDDNSADDTAAVSEALAQQDARVRVVRRTPPAGVGRALRDGYAATNGEYVLTMDCDFAMLVPELRDLFDAVAAGCDGAIGSRFSYDSVLLNYPAGKLVGNRAFHLLVRLLIRRRVRDVSNNLKLYRGDLLRDMRITQDGFAANAETGLTPILAGADIREVPIAWINREADMGASSFKVLKVAPGYAIALVRMLSMARRAARSTSADPSDPSSTIVNPASEGHGDPPWPPASGGTS
jgi:dolichol-phosphate mannosyltransferase